MDNTPKNKFFYTIGKWMSIVGLLFVIVLFVGQGLGMIANTPPSPGYHHYNKGTALLELTRSYPFLNLPIAAGFAALLYLIAKPLPRP